MKNETSPLYLPPHDEIINQIQREEDFKNFLTQNFSFTYDPLFLQSLINTLANRSMHRLINPHYLRFLGRILLMAAEYGFAEITGILDHQYEKGTAGEDPLNPWRLMTQAHYLADINLKSTAYKEIAILKHPKKEAAIWSKYVKPTNGYVPLPKILKFMQETDEKDRYPVRNFRAPRKLPLYKPDSRFHLGVRSIGIDEVVFKQKNTEALVSEYLPKVQDIFKPIGDMNSVFLHREELNPKVPVFIYD